MLLVRCPLVGLAELVAAVTVDATDRHDAVDSSPSEDVDVHDKSISSSSPKGRMADGPTGRMLDCGRVLGCGPREREKLLCAPALTSAGGRRVQLAACSSRAQSSGADGEQFPSSGEEQLPSSAPSSACAHTQRSAVASAPRRASRQAVTARHAAGEGKNRGSCPSVPLELPSPFAWKFWGAPSALLSLLPAAMGSKPHGVLVSWVYNRARRKCGLLAGRSSLGAVGCNADGSLPAIEAGRRVRRFVGASAERKTKLIAPIANFAYQIRFKKKLTTYATGVNDATNTTRRPEVTSAPA